MPILRSAASNTNSKVPSGENGISKRIAAIIFCFAIFLTVGMAACDDLITEQVTIIVAGNPIAEFSVDIDSGCAPLTVNFLDKSSGPHDQWIWKFGDGDSSTDTTPSHTYTTPGMYTVTLRVTDNIPDKPGFDDEVKKRFIVVGSSIAGLTMSDSSGCAGLTVNFTPSFAGATSFAWDFGDGTISTDTFPTHTFTSEGDFPITLSVVGPCGVDSAFDTVSIGLCPTFVLTVDSATVCLGSPIKFTASPNDTVPRLLRTWDFGDGVIVSDTFPDISHTYADTGRFTVTLTALNTDNLSFTDSVVNIVQIFDTLVADFEAGSPSFACKTPTGQFAVLFNDKSRGVITNRIWNFGDGTFDSTNNLAPIHAYVTPGQYSVNLKVFGPCGDSAAAVITRFDLVTLADTLIAVINTSDIGAPIDSIGKRFTDASIGVASIWTWDFGDGTPAATTKEVSHFYLDAPATFTVTLTVNNACTTSPIVTTTIVTIP